ncbi:MAG TPA: hypothetical protein CFH83_06385, partial [Sulfuricurvum kujiense]
GITVDFANGTNTEGYYAISGNTVVLTAAGEAFLDAGNTLPNVSVTTSTGVTQTNTVTTTLINDAPTAVDDYKMTGVRAEYYGYQEGIDGSNLTNITQIRNFMTSNTPDAIFTPTSLNYALGSGNLGSGTNLQTFLGADAASLNTDPGDSSDAIIHMQGFITLNAGTYNFKVTADDGYTILIDGNPVATVNYIQSPTGTVHAPFTVTDGEHSIEIIYWDQAGDYQFKAEISKDGGTSYQVLNVSEGSHSFVTSEDTALTITANTLLSNDTDPDGDTLIITSVSSGIGGTVSIDVDGNVVFTPIQNYHGSAYFDYTISDGLGGSDTARVYLTVTPINDTPTLTIDTGNTNNTNDSVYESGLATGNNSVSNGEFAYGKITVGDVDGLSDIKSITIGSSVFTVGANGLAGLVNSTVLTTDGKVTLTGYNNGVFDYTYELTKATTDVANKTETDSFVVKVTDSSNLSVQSNIVVNIVDDAPKVVEQTIDLHISPITTNLSFIVDGSGSMSATDLQLSLDAINTLVNQYRAFGDVNIKIVEFYDNGVLDTGWISSTQGVTLPTASSGTDIDRGLKAMVDTYSNTSAGYSEANQDIMYFFGDGNDNVGVFDTYLPTWKNFVTSGAIDKLFTYSVNTDTVLADIVAIADNGENLISQDVVNITQISDLAVSVSQTAKLYTEGSFITNSSGTTLISYGADGGHIASVTINGNTEVYDINNPVKEINGSHGVFTLNFETGEYVYRATDILEHTEIVNVSIVDGDGDRVDAILLNINITYDPILLNQPKTIIVGEGDATSWNEVGVYGFTAGQVYKTGSNLDITHLSNGISANITTQLGVTNDRLNFINGTPDTSETLVIHIKEIANSATVTVGNWSNSDELYWEVFASDGTSNGGGVVTTDNLTSFTINGTNGVTGDFEYITFRAGENGSNANADFSINQITFNIPAKTMTTGTSGNEVITGTDGSEIIDGLTGADTINAGAGYDTITFDQNDYLIDGGTGIDTLILPTSVNINFSALANDKVTNMEVIDLNINGNHNITNLSLQDVIDMTDSNNTLTIIGDSADSVNVPQTSGSYSVDKSTDSGFDIYTYSSSNASDPTVTVKIEQDITHS